MTKDHESPNMQAGNVEKRARRPFQLSWKMTGIIIVLILVVGIYFILKVKPPLEVSTVAASHDGELVVIGVGNTGFMSLELQEVKVNNSEQPTETKLQIVSAEQGYTLSDDWESAEAEGYRFVDIDSELIKIGTGLKQTYDETNSAVENAEIYGVTIMHEEPIHEVELTYKHFGMTYQEQVTVDFNTGKN